MSTSVTASILRSSRRSDSTDSSIARIWSRSISMRLRLPSSSMNSARRAHSVQVRTVARLDDRSAGRQHLDAEAGEGARKIGDEARTHAGLGPAGQQCGIGQLMGAVRRRIRAVPAS